MWTMRAPQPPPPPEGGWKTSFSSCSRWLGRRSGCLALAGAGGTRRRRTVAGPGQSETGAARGFLFPLLRPTPPKLSLPWKGGGSWAIGSSSRPLGSPASVCGGSACIRRRREMASGEEGARSGRDSRLAPFSSAFRLLLRPSPSAPPPPPGAAAPWSCPRSTWWSGGSWTCCWVYRRRASRKGRRSRWARSICLALPLRTLLAPFPFPCLCVCVWAGGIRRGFHSLFRRLCNPLLLHQILFLPVLLLLLFLARRLQNRRFFFPLLPAKDIRG